MSKTEQEIEEIVTESRDGYSLADRLRNRKLRQGSITVYTDELGGEALADAEAEVDRIRRAAREAIVDPETHEVIVPAVALDEKALSQAEDVVKELEAQLDGSAISLKWQAVPPIVEQMNSKKAARKFMGSKGKIDPIDEPDVKRVARSGLLAKAVTRWRDHQEDRTFESMSFEEAEALQHLLPRQQWDRLWSAFSETQFTNAIAYAATDNADF
ncbi:hypothetical protein [Agromyces sp. NPDC058104]|uniref:hypothetical protein n=1 Tax=Agromyces sp. NPDC058104 TaxID=3346342 RepID=UPI0036DCBA04